MEKKYTYYAHEPAGQMKMRYIETWLSHVQERTGKETLSILDVGCGSGHLSAFMASRGHDVTAIDHSLDAVKAAKERYSQESVRYQVADLSDIKGTFDVISTFEVCEHVPDLPPFLAEIKKRLSDDGVFLLSVPNGWSLEEMIRHVLQHSSLGKKIKGLLRKKSILPKCDGQSHADSPHVHFRQFGSWNREFRSAGFDRIDTRNVSLWFKQFFYIGARRFIRAGSSLFRLLNNIDSTMVRAVPSYFADGWIMTWEKKK